MATKYVREFVSLCVTPSLYSQDVVKVADILTRHFYHYGDQLLEKKVPVALSFNEMYSITQRLQLPRDAHGVGKWRTSFTLPLAFLLTPLIL